MFKKLTTILWLFLLFNFYTTHYLLALSSAPITISSSDSNPPQIGIDDAGNTIAIWHDFDGRNTNVQSSYLPDGGRWSAPVTISSAPGNCPYDIPQIAVDPAGNAIAIWIETNETSSFVKSSSLPFGGAWSDSAVISKAGNSHNPRVAVDYSGNAVVVWTRLNDNDKTVIEAAILPFAGEWCQVVTLSNSDEDASDPQVVVDNVGNAVAMWTSIVNSDSSIQASYLHFGGSWTKPVTLSQLSSCAFHPKIVVDPQGNVVAIWERNNGSYVSILSSRLLRGGSWSLPVEISTSGFDAAQSDLAIDQSGNAIAVWKLSFGTVTILQSAYFPIGGSWSITLEYIIDRTFI